MNHKSSSGPSEDGAQDSFIDGDDLPTPTAETHEEQIERFSQEMLSRLSRIIEREIVPRLMLAFDSPRASRLDPKTAERLKDSVDEFVQLLLAHDAEVATRYVSMLRSEGTPLPALYLDLLSPAASRLGKLWEDDEVSFTDTTIGVCRMHQVLLEFSRCFDDTANVIDESHNALILPVPGEQHTFGVFMVLEFLRSDGWNCFTGTPSNAKELRRLVEAHDFDVIGFSMSSNRHRDWAAKAIAEIRDGERNADARIVLGGGAFSADPEAALKLGADEVARDAQDAQEIFRRIQAELTEAIGN